jgi:hypothetical protein
MPNFPKGAVLLSRYPQAKLIIECRKCGMRAKYDQNELLQAGGDRPLTYLLDDIVRRKGCTKLNTLYMYDRCAAHYANLTDANTYKKASERR